jgi:hypothetical protein
MDNKAVNALSHRVTMLSVMSVEDTRFERLKEKYESCLEFRDSNENNCFVDGYHLYKGYLFRDNKLCIPKTSMHDFLMWGFMLEVFQDTLEEIKPLKRCNVNSFGLA